VTWNGKRIDWINVVYFSALHVGAVFALWTFSWTALAVFAALLWLSFSLGIGVTYHRLLTHRGYTVPKWLEYPFTVCGMLASESGAISWVAMHRMHHTLSDRPGKDLHTPKDGFLWSHVGWVITRIGYDMRDIERRYAPELVADPVHRVLNRLHLLPNILVALALYAWGGWPLVVWGVFLRLVVGLHATWFVNSAAHTWGYRTYDTPEGSTNLWWVGLIAWGEGWHNNHHAFQRSARHGHEWWELDTNWMVIRTLEKLGLARDVQLLPAGAERFRADRGDQPRAAAMNAASLLASSEPAVRTPLQTSTP
jgi:stearoyl-CoA desaturase (delta-9 desaturase)